MMNATDVLTRRLLKPTRIQKFRTLKETDTTGTIDGYEVDSHTAFIVCSVYDSVNESNQKQLDELSTRDLIAVSIQMVA
jgi:hypothetical protein